MPIISMTEDKKHEEELKKIIDGNYRKEGQPIDIGKLIEIAEKLDELESQDDEKK